MAASTCPHCEHQLFELEEVSPVGSNYKMFFVQCSNCGAPAGVSEYYDVGSLVKEQEGTLAEIHTALGRTNHRLEQMETALAEIARALRRQ